MLAVYNRIPNLPRESSTIILLWKGLKLWKNVGRTHPVWMHLDGETRMQFPCLTVPFFTESFEEDPKRPLEFSWIFFVLQSPIIRKGLHWNPIPKKFIPGA